MEHTATGIKSHHVPSSSDLHTALRQALGKAESRLATPGMLLGGCWGKFPDEFIERHSDWIHRENRHGEDYYVWKRNIVLPENGELFYTLGFFVEALHRLLKPDSELLDF